MLDNNTTNDYDRDEQRKRIGREIADARRLRGLTQTDLADRCGLAQSHIARIETGRYSVGFDTLEQLAEAMGMEIALCAPRGEELRVKD